MRHNYPSTGARRGIQPSISRDSGQPSYLLLVLLFFIRWWKQPKITKQKKKKIMNSLSFYKCYIGRTTWPLLWKFSIKIVFWLNLQRIRFWATEGQKVKKKIMFFDHIWRKTQLSFCNWQHWLWMIKRYWYRECCNWCHFVINTTVW